ncbi:hypothetical protein QTP86_014494 [Hemibagrus guttatus]|nr:hypothetical protein QTP86_014494 [Hemibagrus guttatus]
MIDLSYLTEEEQEAIMAVLKRDAELKKTEEERVNFFFIRFQQRHNPFNNVPMDLDLDETNGASMPETKTPPGTAEVPPPLENREGSEIEAKTKIFNISQETIPHQKPVPKKRTKIFKVQNSDSTSSVSTQSVSTNSSVSTQSVSTSSSTSPVSTQSMSTNSDSRSALSTQSTSTNSEIRSLPPKGILKHSSSCDSNTKSRLPQPRKSLSMASTKSGHEHILEENAVTQESIDESLLNFTEDKEPPKSTFPPSRLPVRSTMLLNNPTQTSKEKPKIQPRLSRSSSTQSNDEQKTADVLDTKQKCENSLNWLISAEAEKQNIADGMMKEPLSIPRIKARSPFESLLAKPLNESITPQISLKNQDKEGLKTSKREYEKTEEKLDRPSGIRDRLVYEATNPTNASNKTDPSLEACESDHMPSPFDIKITRDSNMKTKNCKNPLMVNPYSPKASEEKGDSIAKVLEWFSRSSDSSDKLDCEGIIPDIEDDIKIEDMDFENEINSRPKAENNVYLIIPRHRDEDRATEVSLVQEVLRRAPTRPVYHKSFEDITAVPRRSKKSKHVDNFVPSSYANSSTPSPSSSSFSDKERLRKISKSVPSFLENENDGDESESECSSQSGKHWKNSSPQAELNNNPRMATVSSMSGSIMSISSVDFGNIEVQGTIQFSINYVQKLREFHIFVVQCQNLAAVDVKRNRSDPYVKSYLLPDAANLGKRKTSVKKKTVNPTYNEILRYRVRLEHLKTQVLNLSVWHNDIFGRNSFLGEAEIDLSKWDFGSPRINCLPLKPRNTSSVLSTDDRGEMRLAIRFLPQISFSKPALGSGEIHIWVRDCKNLPLIRGVTVNPYVKCYVLPDTSKKSCQKTRVLKRTASPVFNHTMVYDGFRTEDLKEACVELTVWDRDRLADHLVGGLRLGLGTGQSYGTKVDWMDSIAKEVALWQRMMDSPNEWVEDVLPLRMVTAAKNTLK